MSLCVFWVQGEADYKKGNFQGITSAASKLIVKTVPGCGVSLVLFRDGLLGDVCGLSRGQ